ncbi:uncharacterized protein DFL_009907 [Arthrobotrys flagrans]|uniref:Glycosyl transferase family 28 C-terminal domain-containing protein n=1 Tax=Arthrobotrys flagrans TaxID=97331 RepID=A0A436ZSY8_ARTFL|nr:hypothetical protein DFL_009907 [Arthrobotrys flagrans]
MSPSHIAYYISSHGYGHATRAIQLCHSFLRAYDGIQITVVSQASSHIFLPLLNASDRVNLRPVNIDSAVIQPTPYSLDVDKTVRNLLDLSKDDVVKQEEDWLKGHDVDLVLVDAPFAPCIAASRAGVLSFLITNFSFAEVFSYFTSMVEPDLQPLLSQAVDEVVKGYSHADIWLRLPGWLPNPGFLPATLPSSTWVSDEALTVSTDGTITPEYSLSRPNFQRKIIDTPLITRPATTTSRADLLKMLGIPPFLQSHKILLLLLPLPDPPPQIPSDWVCVVAGSTPTMLLPDRYFIAPGDIHIPDVMEISSCVMAKLGYGTVSEVLAADVPLVYIPRRQFVEEYGLRHLVETFSGYENRAERLEIEEFEKGYWWWMVTELASREKSGELAGLVDDGDAIRRIVVEQWDNWKSLA